MLIKKNSCIDCIRLMDAVAKGEGDGDDAEGMM